MTRTRHGRRLAAVAMAAGASVVVVATAPVGAATRPVVITQGHVDALDIAYEGGELGVSIHDDTVEPDVERDPDDVLLVALPSARTTVPDDPAYRFLGRPGAPVWVLPQIQDPDLLWPGLATEEIDAGVFDGDSVRLRLVRVTGPGDVALFTADAFGAPQILFDSGDGLPDRTDLPVGTHAHQNWAFDRPGDYRLTFEASGLLAEDGTRVSSGRVTIAYQVQR
jgi:surface-anchored protein